MASFLSLHQREGRGKRGEATLQYSLHGSPRAAFKAEIPTGAKQNSNAKSQDRKEKAQTKQLMQQALKNGRFLSHVEVTVNT